MRASRFAWAILFSAAFHIAGALAAGSATAQSDEALKALNQRLIELYKAGKFGEAIPVAERYAEATKVRHGAEHPEYATALINLAQLLQDTIRLAEAEPLMRRALAIDEKSSGPDHPNVARDLNNLAGLLRRSQPAGRGRAALSSRARHRRGASARTTPTSPFASTIWRSTSTTPTGSARPSH